MQSQNTWVTTCDWDLSKGEDQDLMQFFSPVRWHLSAFHLFAKGSFHVNNSVFSTSSRENFQFLSSSRPSGMDPNWSPNLQRSWPNPQELSFPESPLANKQKQAAARNQTYPCPASVSASCRSLLWKHCLSWLAFVGILKYLALDHDLCVILIPREHSRVRGEGILFPSYHEHRN